MIKTLDNTQIDSRQWQNLAEFSPVATFFQTKECYEFYSSLSFLKPFLIGVSENEKLTGLVCGYFISDGNFIKRFLSRRAIIPGGALLAENISDEALKLLLLALKNKTSGKAIYIEFRNYNDYSAWRTVFEQNNFYYQPHLNFHVATPDKETALKNLSTTKRRDVKLSLKEGVEITTAHNKKDIAAYYHLLENLYKTKVKTPLFPLDFFEKLTTMPHGRIFLIKHQNQVIGGSVCAGLEGKTLYEWFVCGADGKHKNIYPSTLATWAGIEYAAENKYRHFDMMGAGKPNEGYGVREFKSKFGGELVEYGRFLHVINPVLFGFGKKIINFLKKKK